ncbi:MAG: SGNH/GDSL hydrolase family protein [Nitrospiraceae bacterium]
MEARKTILVHMGDSITFGQYVDPTLRWTSLIENRLRAHERTQDRDIQTFNRGISGETTRMGLERFPSDVQALRPDVMTLQFGLNDCNCWQTDLGAPRVSERAFAANLTEMIDRARRFGAREIVLATNHRTLRRAELMSGEAYEDANARYSEVIRRVAQEAAVTLCDMREVFMPFDDATLERMLLPAPDQLHLSIEGNRVYADAIWPFVLKAVERTGSLIKLEGTEG